LADLSKKRERERLKLQRDPHFMKLDTGAYLGFRRGPDTWHARFRDKKNTQHYKALDGLSRDDYVGAKRAAEDWFGQMGAPAVRSVKRATVADALRAYLDDLERQGRTDAAKDARGRFKLTVDKDTQLSRLPLEAATRDDFEEWRARLKKGRKPRSVNRQVRAVMAGLNRAQELGHVGNPAAWTLKALSDSVEEEGDTAMFLNPAQRKALIAAADGYTAAFLRGLELTGSRPGELAGATIRDFDGMTLRFAHRKGRGGKIRVRRTVLGTEGVEFFTIHTNNKPDTSPLFTEDGKTPWRRHMWARRVREALKVANKDAHGAARLPAEVGAYAFRHARISELLQIYGIDPLTVGQQTGTSLAMIEKTYLKFIPSAMQDKLAAVITKG
jgi:integrase